MSLFSSVKAKISALKQEAEKHQAILAVIEELATVVEKALPATAQAVVGTVEGAAEQIAGEIT
jgi:hypothetical protein